MVSRPLLQPSFATALLMLGCNGDGTANSATDSGTSTLGTTDAATATGASVGPATATGTTAVATATDSDGASTSTEGPSTSAPTTAPTEGSTTEGSTTEGSTTEATTTEGSTTDGLCPEGTQVCDEGIAKTCDGMGGYSSEETCENLCAEGLGCVLCLPGDSICVDGDSEICADDGMSYDDKVECDEVQGVTCDEGSGSCVGVCSPGALGLSYIGCEYFPTVTANAVTNNFNFAVAVANTSDMAAKVRIDRGADTLESETVAPNSVKIITLPWIDALKVTDSTDSIRVDDGAYRLRSDQPVTVYQFSPLEYTLNDDSSYSNDASLLLPVNTWTGDYFVAARNTWRHLNNPPGYPGFYAVTAAQDGTTVELGPSATGKVINPGGGVAADGTGTVVLDRGDVLQVFSGDTGLNPSSADVTGSHVTADKPIQVLGGHICTFVPHDVGFCDHLEEAIPPFEVLAKEYIVTPPLIPTGGNTPKAEMVRIVATSDNTSLTYDPPQGGAPATIPKAGDYVEISQTDKDFRITADKKVLVAQFMLGQAAGGDSGDPALTVAVGVDQYRSDYLFHAPTNYEKNFVNITAPEGTEVLLDGMAVDGFSPIGGTGFGVARVELSNNGDGNHEVTSDQPVGISIYGYGQYTSYWYPGGLNLELLPQ